MPVYPAINEAADFIRTQFRRAPVLGLILGSGLGACADCLTGRTVIPSSSIPHFPLSSTFGHSGNVILGELAGVPTAALQGRLHLYEGFSAAEAAFPARVLGCLGILRLIVTNAAGGINPTFRPGDLMLITDHINLMAANPLAGPNLDALGPRFPDMSEAYDASMRAAAFEAAREMGIELHEGIYIGLPGPSYETPAEIRMCRNLGADAVGMSTIPEVIAANHMGIRVLGISCITNMAAGVGPGKLTHGDVVQTAENASARIQSLIQALVPRLR
jgi:purine-nucleoside phosphorylase